MQYEYIPWSSLSPPARDGPGSYGRPRRGRRWWRPAAACMQNAAKCASRGKTWHIHAKRAAKMCIAGHKVAKVGKEACEWGSFSPFGRRVAISVRGGDLCAVLGLRVLVSGPRAGAARSVAWQSMLAAAAAPSLPSRRAPWRPVAKCAHKGANAAFVHQGGTLWALRVASWHGLCSQMVGHRCSSRVRRTLYSRTSLWPEIVSRKVLGVLGDLASASV